VIGAIVLLFLFSLNLISSQVRGFTISVSSPFQAALWHAGDNVSTFFAGGSLRIENKLLRQENLKLTSRIIELQVIEKENEELRSVLEFGLKKEFELAIGKIIAKNITDDTIIIRGGKDMGIQKDMPVITSSKVAVGKVVEVFNAHSLVRLLSVKKTSLDAQIAESEVTGLIRGQGGQKLLLDLVPQEEELSMEDIVLTSNVGDAFPEGFLIGEIVEVKKSGADPFQKGVVRPFFTIKSAETVFVITSWEL
jgi:rod shape-determining protein MreC